MINRRLIRLWFHFFWVSFWGWRLCRAFWLMLLWRCDRLDLFILTCLDLHIERWLHYFWRDVVVAIRHLFVGDVERRLYFGDLFYFGLSSTILFYFIRIFSIINRSRNQHLRFEYRNIWIGKEIQSEEVSFFRRELRNVFDYASEGGDSWSIGYHDYWSSLRNVERWRDWFHSYVLWFSWEILWGETIFDSCDDKVDVFSLWLPGCECIDSYCIEADVRIEGVVGL